MSGFAERLLEPGKNNDLGHYVDTLLDAYPLFPEMVLSELSSSDPYARLRFEMKRRNVRNQALAAELGIHESGVARAFSRRTGLEKHWDAIAKFLKVDPAWLIDGAGVEAADTNRSRLPLLGAVNAKLDGKFLKLSAFMSVQLNGAVQVTEDIPRFHLVKGNYLLLVKKPVRPNMLAVVRLKNGSAKFGRLMEHASPDEPAPTGIILHDGTGRVFSMKESTVAEVYCVDGVLFGHQFDQDVTLPTLNLMDLNI